jgi:hypothetical protein
MIVIAASAIVCRRVKVRPGPVLRPWILFGRRYFSSWQNQSRRYVFGFDRLDELPCGCLGVDPELAFENVVKDPGLGECGNPAAVPCGQI